jgi:hypothetical protein
VTEGDALSMDSAEIGGRFFLREGFETSGTIRMPGAQVKSDFDCTGAKLEVKNEYALFADGAEIRGNALFCKAFESSGKISLRGARVGGKIEFVGATVAQVDCTNLNASGDLYWMKIKVSDATSLDLRGASVKNLYDDEDSWPQKGKGNLFLNELVYEELILEPAPNDAREGTKKRIQWLNRQPDKRYIRPQPWMQLSKYLEARGRHREAKHVLYELMCLQAKNRWPKFFLMRWLAVAFAFLEEWPLRILYSIAFTVLLGWLVFGYAGANGAKGAIAPTKTEARDQYVSKGTLPATYPEWNSFIYTLENAVPLVKLGQDEKWAPIRQYPGTNWFTNYWFLMWSRWLLILSGWVQATVLAAALSGRFKP